jgi:transposase-like protein
MAYNLAKEKKVAVVSMLCEGASIRSIERITGVNRNTIMSLNQRVGTACAQIMDERFRNLHCRNVEIDEIWGFVGKK